MTASRPSSVSFRRTFCTPRSALALLLVSSALAHAAVAGVVEGFSPTVNLSIDVTQEGNNPWSPVKTDTPFLTVDSGGAIAMPSALPNTTNWTSGQTVMVYNKNSQQFEQKQALTWTNSLNSASFSIFATGNVDPFMTYGISARNTSDFVQTYTLHLAESIVPPIAPGTYSIYTDIAGSISNGAGTITISPTAGKIQKLSLSTDTGANYFNAGVDIGDALTTSNPATTPYPLMSLNGGGSTLDAIDYWSFDISFTLSPHDSAAISGFAEITQLTVIPEPSTYAALMGAVTLFGAALRRRRQTAA